MCSSSIESWLAPLAFFVSTLFSFQDVRNGMAPVSPVVKNEINTKFEIKTENEVGQSISIL